MTVIRQYSRWLLLFIPLLLVLFCLITYSPSVVHRAVAVTSRFSSGTGLLLSRFVNTSTAHNVTPFLLPIDAKQVSEILYMVYLEVLDAWENKRPPSLSSINTLRQLAWELDPRFSMESYMEQNKYGAGRWWEKDINYHMATYKGKFIYEDVCPEVFYNASTGWMKLPCNTSHSVTELFSFAIILFSDETFKNDTPEQTKHRLNILLDDVERVYPNVRVYIAGADKWVDAVTAKPRKLRVHFISRAESNNISVAHMWNKLIEKVPTTYVMVWRDLYRFNEYVKADRLIRVISKTPGVVIAAGATRNQTTHWKGGCYQTNVRNYVLEYKIGYYYSYSECMFCDYVDGPFMARVDVLRAYPFDEELPSGSIFFDNQLTLSHRFLHMMCPDVMYYANDHFDRPENHDKLTWKSLANKWVLNRIILPPRTILRYECNDVDIVCSPSQAGTEQLMMPICCQEELARGLKTWHEFALKNNIHYQLDANYRMGGFKLQDLLPWDSHIDMIYYSANQSLIEKNVEFFRIQGVVLDGFTRTMCCDKKGRHYNGSFHLKVSDLVVEMWGEAELPEDTSLPQDVRDIPTIVTFLGVSLFGPPNPGNITYTRYGQQGPSLGQNLSTVFKPCTLNHHSCLDRFLVDGDTPFRIPW